MGKHPFNYIFINPNEDDGKMNEFRKNVVEVIEKAAYERHKEAEKSKMLKPETSEIK